MTEIVGTAWDSVSYYCFLRIWCQVTMHYGEICTKVSINMPTNKQIALLIWGAILYKPLLEKRGLLLNLDFHQVHTITLLYMNGKQYTDNLHPEYSVCPQSWAPILSHLASLLLLFDHPNLGIRNNWRTTPVSFFICYYGWAYFTHLLIEWSFWWKFALYYFYISFIAKQLGNWFDHFHPSVCPFLFFFVCLSVLILYTLMLYNVQT